MNKLINRILEDIRFQVGSVDEAWQVRRGNEPDIQIISGKRGYLGKKVAYRGPKTVEAVTAAVAKAAKKGWAKVLFNSLPVGLDDLAAALGKGGRTGNRR